MASIRILVVDDSVVIRKLLCDILSNDPELEVIASAGDGRIALAKIAQLHPDLVTLDIEMPVMNGLETLVQIRKSNSKLPVIMFTGSYGSQAATSSGLLMPVWSDQTRLLMDKVALAQKTNNPADKNCRLLRMLDRMQASNLRASG